MAETTIILILSFIITWVIGLVPPLLIRYVIIRKPITKTPAVIVAGIFLIINLSIFIALGSKAHVVLILIAYVSYRILRKVKSGRKNGVAEGPPKEQ